MTDDLNQAVEAYKRGDKEQCLQIVGSFLKTHPDSEEGFLLAAQCLEDRDKQRQCYRRVFQINPDNEHARRALKPWAKRKLEQEIERLTAKGWQIKSQTEESVQMLKPKKAKISTAEVLLLIISFVVGVPFPPLLIFAIGGLIYVGVKYLRSEDRTLYLSLERIMRGKSISNS
jgi:hypothetical protein